MIRALQMVGAPWLLLFRSIVAVRRNGLSLRECVVQTHELANRTVWLVVTGLGFFGAVAIILANNQARRLTGNLVVLGPPFFELMIREFGPLASALLAAARMGAGGTAELSAMAVNEQLEALEMSAGDPLSDLLAPRIIASVVGVPVLALMGILAASGSAALTALVAFGVDGRAFIDPRYVDFGDMASAFLKAIGCGLYIPLAAGWRGLTARGGASAVGASTTEGVVLACLGCLVIDFGVTLAFFFLRL
jgi:phospholipid/cholesterol/gamma-HCH transport system permease protein